MKRFVLPLLCSLSMLAASSAYGRLISVTPISTTVNEGSSKTFTVQVSSFIDEMVYLTTSHPALSISPSSLSYPAYSDAIKTVTVSAGHDDDSFDDQGTITMTDAYAGEWTTYTINIDDDDTPALVVASTLSIKEGATKTFTVKLATKPYSVVSIYVTRSGDNNVGFSPARLSFSNSNWNTPQNVTVSASEDPDASDGTATLSLRSSDVFPEYRNLSAQVKVSVDDNDTAALITDKTTVALAEGGSSTFTVRLATWPMSVTVNLASSLDHVSVSPTRLTFHGSQYASAQTVTLSTGEDSNGYNESATITLSASGDEYDNVTGSVKVDVQDNDTRGFLVSGKRVSVYGRLSMGEGGTETLEMRLSTQPVGGNVTVNMSASDGSDVTFSPTSLIFTPSNWDTKQTFTASAAEDDDESNDDETFSLLAKGGDYNDLSYSRGVFVADNDFPNIVRIPTGDVTVKEGESITFNISLSAALEENRTIIHSIPEHHGRLIRETFKSNSFSFTPQNWNKPQTVTYYAPWDTDKKDFETRMITAFYGGAHAVRNTITIAENDTHDALVLSTEHQLNIHEGESATFTVKLRNEPFNDEGTTDAQERVTVNLKTSGSRDLGVSPSSLAFTPSDWDTPQTVTVSTSEDTDSLDDVRNVSLTADGTNFGRETTWLTITVLDKSLVVSPSTLSIKEGESKDFSVKLGQIPKGDVTVGAMASDSQGSVSPATLTFTRSNWDTNQTFTVTIAEDDDGIAETFSITLAAVGSNYNGVSASVAITSTENDALGLNVDTTLSVDEGDDSTLAVSLSAQPTGGNVTIDLSKSGSTDVTFSPSSLTFSGSNWNTEQDITVSAAEDDDAAVDKLTLSLDASGANYDDVSASVKVDVVENDTVGLTTDPASDFGVTEGSSSTFTVRLAAEPTGGDVTVALASSGSSDVTLSTTSLTFKPSQWSTPQTITVNAAEDDDGSNDSASVSLSASGADYEDVTGGLDVTVTDNDSPGLTISSTKLKITEGTSEDITVRLAIQPSGNVSVSLTLSGSDDVTLSPATLDFTSTNWSSTQTFTVSAAPDADANDDTASISIVATGADYDNVSESATVDVSDDESHELIVSPSSTLGLTEGGGDDITVKLSAQPTGDVDVNLTTSGSGDVSLSKTKLSFTSDNWNTIQSVTVSAAEDDDGISDNASVSLAASGADFDGVSDSVKVSVTDNDTPGLTLLPSGNLKVSEGDDSSFTVRLAIQPTSEVSIALTTSGSDDVTLSPTSLTFTTSNWDSPQKIEASAAEDDDAVTDTTNVLVTASGADYDNITGNIQIQTVENDTRGLTISPSTLGLTEGDDSTFTVRLNALPTGNVTIGLAASGSADVSLSPASLNFTASNWNTPQTVTATADADDNVEEDIVNVSLTAAGADYGGVTGSLKVTITDNGTPGLTLSSAKLTITEGDEESFTVKLATQPSQTVTLELLSSGDPDMIVDTDPVTIGPQNNLTFTKSSWDSAQTVTVSAAEDNDGAADTASITLNASGGEYGVVSNNVQVSITDNDTPGLSISPHDLGVTEGSDNTFSVKLSAQPTGGDVTIVLARSGSPDVAASPASLTFTRSDWSTEQTVTVSAAEDADGIAESADISLSASGADFDGVTGSIEIQVTDNDTPGLILSHLTLPVPEGESGIFATSLAVQPSGDVTIDLTKRGSDDVTWSPTSLKFTSADWDTAKAITVSAAEDDDIAMDTAIISLDASGADYEGITGTVQVDVNDNEIRDLDINPAALGLTEGSSDIFVVKLSSQPTWNVSVALTSSGSDDITISPSNLAFDPNNWNTTQTVTVSAAEDDDRDSDTATAFLVASGADYSDVTGSVQILVTDNDAPGLTVSPNSLSMVEGEEREFTASLAVQPSTQITLDLTSSNPDAILSSSRLTFTTADWSAKRTVTVSAAEDDDFDDDPATVSLTASGGEYEGIVGSLSAWIMDNDIPQITLSSTALTVIEGSDNTFTVRLKTRPINEDTTLDLALSGSPDITFSPERLIFTVSNWDKDQTVTVSAAEDDDEEDESGTISMTGILNGESIIGSVQVSVTDNNSRGTTLPTTIFQELIFPSTTWLEIDEGSSATFTVRAKERPPESVVITLSRGGSTDVTFDTDSQTGGNQNTLTITPDDWNVDRSVRVDATEDDDAFPDRANVSFRGSVDNVVITGNMPVDVADNDTPGLSALPAALTVDESSSANFAVRLDTQPLGNVVLTFDNGDSDTALSPSNLIFTPTNWRRARNVTVSGVSDVDDTDDDPADISISAKGGGYDGIGTRVQVRVDEAPRGSIPITDLPGFVVTGAPVDLDEGGMNDFYLRLLNRPTADVRVTFAVTGENVTVDTNALSEGNQDTLVFSPSNFNGTRMVNVFAAEDDDRTDEVERLSFSAQGGNYEGLEAAISVSVDDNDSPSLIVSQPRPTGIDGPQAKFTVNLSTPPSGQVRVTMSLPSSVAGMTLDTDLDTPGNQNTLVFTLSNFETPQSVYLTVNDDFQSRSASITLLAAGGNYDGVSDILTVMMIDIDTILARGDSEYSDRGDPRYWWPVQALALAIPPLQAGDQAMVNIGCRQDSDCEVFLVCSAQTDGASFRGGLPEPIPAWGIASLSASDIVAITGANRPEAGRLGCALHSESHITTQVWTRSGDGVLVNNSAFIPSVDLEGTHQADVESIPGPDDQDLSNIRIRCRAPYPQDCTSTRISCFDDDGFGYDGYVGTIARRTVRHLQTSELADIIGHRWKGATLGCELRSDAPFTVQILTRTGGGGALVNNNAASSLDY